jgi:predicted N-acetyltransferase YhbS
MGRDVVHLCRTWATADPMPRTAPGLCTVRALGAGDVPGLGRLMWAAFRGTVDDEGETVAGSEAEVAATLAGKWGPVVWPASLVAEQDGEIVSAAITVLDDAHEGMPLLAFTMTDPKRQGQGLAGHLIEECIRGLHGLGVRELHLAVTRGNPAYHLYRRLGFEVVLSVR